MQALANFAGPEQELESLLAEKERLEHLHAHARLGLQRLKGGAPRAGLSPSRLHEALTDLRAALTDDMKDRLAEVKYDQEEFLRMVYGLTYYVLAGIALPTAAQTNTQTGTYTTVAGDSGKLVIMNCSAACTVTR